MLQLRDYQDEGRRFLASGLSEKTARHRVRCLFDDPGLGKTPTLCVAIGAPDHPEILLCPAGLIDTWREHLTKWAPRWRVHVPKNSFVVRPPADGEVLILSTDLLATLQPRKIRSKDENRIKRAMEQEEKRAAVLSLLRQVRQRTCMTIDEVQQIKSAASARSLAFESLWKDCVRPKGGMLRILSGTPDPNSLLDLWVILECCGIAKDIFKDGIVGFAHYAKGHYDYFKRRWEFGDRPLGPIRDVHGVGRFILRRTQEEVLGELPQPTAVVTRCKVPDSMIELADDVLRWAVASIGEETSIDRREEALVQALTSKAARDLGDLSKFRKSIAEHKIPVLEERLFQLKAEGRGVPGRPIIVYSDHLPPINHFDTDEWRAKGWAVLRGSDSRKARTDAVQALREGKLSGLAMTGAGRVGYTLIEADYMIKLSPSWSWDDELQAERRLIRYGQTKPVTIETIVADHEIERMVLKVLQRKQIRSRSTWA